jgi:hypothetical protein
MLNNLSGGRRRAVIGPESLPSLVAMPERRSMKTVENNVRRCLVKHCVERILQCVRL